MQGEIRDNIQWLSTQIGVEIVEEIRRRLKWIIVHNEICKVTQKDVSKELKVNESSLSLFLNKKEGGSKLVVKEFIRYSLVNDEIFGVSIRDIGDKIGKIYSERYNSRVVGGVLEIKESTKQEMEEDDLLKNVMIEDVQCYCDESDDKNRVFLEKLREYVMNSSVFLSENQGWFKENEEDHIVYLKYFYNITGMYLKILNRVKEKESSK